MVCFEALMAPSNLVSPPAACYTPGYLCNADANLRHPAGKVLLIHSRPSASAPKRRFGGLRLKRRSFQRLDGTVSPATGGFSPVAALSSLPVCITEGTSWGCGSRSCVTRTANCLMPAGDCLTPEGSYITPLGSCITQLANCMTQLANCVMELAGCITKSVSCVTQIAGGMPQLANCVMELGDCVMQFARGDEAIRERRDAIREGNDARPLPRDATRLPDDRPRRGRDVDPFGSRPRRGRRDGPAGWSVAAGLGRDARAGRHVAATLRRMIWQVPRPGGTRVPRLARTSVSLTKLRSSSWAHLWDPVVVGLSLVRYERMSDGSEFFRS